MFNNIKKQLYNVKTELLLKKGLANGTIKPFEKELFERLDNIYIDGIPMSLYLIYLNPINFNSYSSGDCYNRSLYITMGLDDAILVRGNDYELELQYGKDESGHGWVEKDDWVYEPTLMLKFKKDVYYQLYKPHNIKYYKKEEYSKDKNYKYIMNTKIEDLMPNGEKRETLNMTLSVFIDKISQINDPLYEKLLTNHLKKIQYGQYESYKTK